MRINWYGILLLTGIASGFVSATLLGASCKIKRQTLAYTAFLNLLCVLVFSFMEVFYLSAGKLYGMSGLGGALGLMIGTIASVYIHNDHHKELFSSWVVSAPLMYAVAKTACLYAGCCSGSFFGLPIQPVVSLAFLLIYIISLIVFIRSQEKSKAAYMAMLLAFVMRIVLDFFHDSHHGHLVSREQIMVLVAGSIAFILFLLRKKLPKPR